jgi:hypothetical protein
MREGHFLLPGLTLDTEDGPEPSYMASIRQAGRIAGQSRTKNKEKKMATHASPITTAAQSSHPLTGAK